MKVRRHAASRVSDIRKGAVKLLGVECRHGVAPALNEDVNTVPCWHPPATGSGSSLAREEHLGATYRLGVAVGGVVTRRCSSVSLWCHRG